MGLQGLQSSLGIQDPPQISKSTDAQVPYVKWLGTVGPPYPWVLHLWIHQPQIELRLVESMDVERMDTEGCL